MAYDNMPSKGGTPMDEEDFEGAVSNAITDACQYIDTNVAPEREKALSYYRGDPLGTEEDGRSQIVMTEVRDVVQAMLPSLLRVFVGSERAVEFTAKNELEVQMASEMTETVNYIFHDRNGGFKILLEAFKDALISKTGILTWWHEEKVSPRIEVYDNFTNDMIALLEAEDDIEIIDVEEEHSEFSENHELPTPQQVDPTNPTPDPLAGQLTSPQPDTSMIDPAVLDALKTFKVTVKRYTKENLIRVTCVPPEQYFIARDARGVEDALVQGRRQEMLVGDLVALGYDYDTLMEYAGGEANGGMTGATNNEALVRVPALGSFRDSSSVDPSTRRILYTEAWIKVDKDGDGIPELRRVCTVGETYHVIFDEQWSEDVAPFAILCPDPLPHAAIGNSIADQVIDLQLLKTNVIRNTLDSLASSIHPRLLVTEGQASLDDCMNTEIGAIIRVRSPEAVQELNKTFIGQQVYPMLQYFDQIRMRRTGVADTVDLDPSALQSTTASAVDQQANQRQERVEMVARIFAETGIKQMFKGILRLILKHVKEELPIRVSGQFKRVNPGMWHNEVDVSINVGIGRGTDQQRLSTLGQIAAKQEAIIQQAGPQNPLVGPQELRNTYQKMLEISGIKEASNYFKQVPPNWQPPPPANQAASDQAMLAQAQVLTANVAKQKADQENMRELLKIRLQDDLERDKLAQERALKELEIQAKYGMQSNQGMVDAKLDFELQKQRNEFDQAFQSSAVQQDYIFQAFQAQADREHAAQMAQQQQQGPMGPQMTGAPAGNSTTGLNNNSNKNPNVNVSVNTSGSQSSPAEPQTGSTGTNKPLGGM